MGKIDQAPNDRLQSGHGVTAVETPGRPRDRPPARPPFNWATASPPWKLNHTLSGVTVEVYLQFGHGVTAVETRGPRGRSTATSFAFNWATASPPWKRPELACDPRHPNPPSIGPRRHRRGNSPPRNRSTCGVLGSPSRAVSHARLRASSQAARRPPAPSRISLSRLVESVLRAVASIPSPLGRSP
jgi:hypothetical protein